MAQFCPSELLKNSRVALYDANQRNYLLLKTAAFNLKNNMRLFHTYHQS